MNLINLHWKQSKFALCPAARGTCHGEQNYVDFFQTWFLRVVGFKSELFTVCYSQKLTFLSSGAGPDSEMIKADDFDMAADILKQGKGFESFMAFFHEIAPCVLHLSSLFQLIVLGHTFDGMFMHTDH